MAVGQRRRRCPGPFTGWIGGNGIHFFTVDNDAHHAVFLRGTGKVRSAVIGDITARQVARFQPRIIKHAINRRFYRRRGINDEADRIGRIADVTDRINDHDNRFMIPFWQRFLRCDFPFAVIANNRGTYHFIVNNQAHGVAWRTVVATEYRLGVVGGVPVVNRAGNRADVILNVTNDRFDWCFQIDDKLKVIRRFARMACRIGDHHLPDMLAFRQRFFRGDGPFTVFTHDRGADHFVVHNQLNGIARC